MLTLLTVLTLKFENLKNSMMAVAAILKKWKNRQND